MTKYALITGGNKGIGFETVKQLAAQGMQVFFTSRDEQRGLEALQRLTDQEFSNIILLAMDVTDPESIGQAKRQLEQQVPQLDILINNAGIRGDIPQLASDVSDQTLRTVFDTNFFGMIQVTQAFLPLLKKSDQPRIVNVSSDLGSLSLRSNPDWQYSHLERAAYGPSKTALNAYTVSLAYELKDTPFKVNAVNPGFTATDFNGFKGTKKAEDAATLIVQYATLLADGPSGQFWSDDGVTPW